MDTHDKEAPAPPQKPAKKKKRSLKKRISRGMGVTLAPPVVKYWLYLFDYTARKNNQELLTLINHEELQERVGSRQNPSIIALWHNRLMFGPTAYKYLKGRGTAIMVSRSFDGDIIAATLKSFKDFIAVRGGSASKAGTDKGGKEALSRMIELAGEGYDLCITPDGPQGPVYEVKRGIIDLARTTGLPIYTVGCSCSKWVEAKSWDKTKLPLPWTRVVYRASEPMWIPQDAGEDLIEQKRQELQKTMLDLTEFADHFFD
ncbi:MAG: lysophospholipid acyltransferase family protein [bacterium]